MSKRTDTCIEADGKWQGGGGAGRLTGWMLTGRNADHLFRLNDDGLTTAARSRAECRLQEWAGIKPNWTSYAESHRQNM